MDELNTSKDEIESFEDELFGSESENEDGETKKEEGLKEKIENLYEKQNSIIDAQLKKIENDLNPAGTTYALAGIFKDKVSAFQKAELCWSVLFLFALSGGFLFLNKIIPFDKELAFDSAFVSFIQRLPLLILIAWGLFFIGSRRAESKKLAESYKHKEVMARAYIGYKKAIHDLDQEDNKLVLSHMNNLLAAMNRDSSDFLITKSEKIFNLPETKKDSQTKD